MLEHSWKEKKVLELSAREDQFWIGQDQSVLIPLASPLDLIYLKFLVVSRWYFISWLMMMMKADDVVMDLTDDHHQEPSGVFLVEEEEIRSQLYYCCSSSILMIPDIIVGGPAGC